MRQPLMAWLEEVCTPQSYARAEYWTILCQMLKLDYTGQHPYDAVVKAANADNDLLLDLVDARLSLGQFLADDVSNLRVALHLAGSGWRVNAQGKALEEVVDDTVRATAQAAIESAKPSASAHLANAWAATYGRNRNPTEAHAEMIRAVESAAIPVITPNDSKATLGTIIGQLESQARLYTTSGASATNDGIDAVVQMMKCIWQQQTDRHGADPTIPATEPRVEFLLPMTAALVQAFSSGHVTRKR